MSIISTYPVRPSVDYSSIALSTELSEKSRNSTSEPARSLRQEFLASAEGAQSDKQADSFFGDDVDCRQLAVPYNRFSILNDTREWGPKDCPSAPALKKKIADFLSAHCGLRAGKASRIVEKLPTTRPAELNTIYNALVRLHHRTHNHGEYRIKDALHFPGPHPKAAKEERLAARAMILFSLAWPGANTSITIPTEFDGYENSVNDYSVYMYRARYDFEPRLSALEDAENIVKGKLLRALDKKGTHEYVEAKEDAISFFQKRGKALDERIAKLADNPREKAYMDELRMDRWLTTMSERLLAKGSLST